MYNTQSTPILTEELRDGFLINHGTCGILGLVLNSLIFLVLIKILNKGEVHSDIKICTFVALTDIFVSLGLLFRSIFTRYPYNILKFHPNWCKFDGLIITQGINCSGYTLGVMAVERFFLICFNIRLPTLFWFCLIVLQWALLLGPTIVCVIDEGQLLTATELSCTFVNFGLCYYTFIIACSLFVISFLAVIISYTGIMIFKFKQCLNQINLNIPKDQVYIELRATLFKSFIYILLYILVFSGKIYTLLYLVITGRKRTLLMDAISQNLLAYSSSVNAIILLYMNQKVRENLIQLLKSIILQLLSN